MIRHYFLQIFTFIVAFVFTVRLAELQLISSNYKSLSEDNAVLESPIFPDRGFIYDRNNKILVANQPGYDLMVVPENIREFDTLELSRMLGLSQKQLKLNIQKSINYSKKIPSIISSEISKEKHAIIQEKLWNYDGFYLQRKSIRKYFYDIGANFLGYISEVNENDINKDPYYQPGELIGKQGVEKYYENILRGEKGISFYQKDRFNRIIGSYQNGKYDVEPKTASNISLTIDLELQKYGESLFKNKRGGIVAIEPETGEILALVSAPSYDPKLLIGKERSFNYKKLANDTISKPLFDRGLQAQYSPGSPFKVLNALIGLQERIINPSNQHVCNKGHFYAKGAFMGCHCKIGTKNNLISAIHQSCNTYFAKTYKGIINSKGSSSEGVNSWKKHLSSFGLGKYLGYDLPVGQPGFIPDAKYYDKWYKKGGWGASTIISNSIGQGEILTTPIQMANFTAAIANRGYFITPHFIKSTNDYNNKKIFKKNITSIDSIHFEPVIDGMEKVIQNGTAKIAKIKGIDVCGKTGTVENFIRLNNKKTQLTDHSMFIAFAPKENPKIAIAVFVENGYWGSRWAAPIGSLMIEKYINKSTTRKWLENRMLNGSLNDEYLKPITGKTFKINE
tara:strand:- start:374 stop:2236 length:1863 start_codon:yes stop_codon:yes gene_type:complete